MRPQQADTIAAQQARWLRCDAYRWLRPDAAKFVKRGTDPVDVYPALARQRDRKRRDADRAFADALEYERAVLDELRRELAEINAELALRRAGRAAEEKYSPSQPRVPGGHGRESGRWTSGDDGSGARPRVVIDTTTFGDDASGDEGAGGDSSYDGADSNPGFDDPGDSYDNHDLAYDAPGERVDLGDEFDPPTSRDDRSTGDNAQPASSSPIDDSRVLSDADPELVRPGEQYAANIRSLRDANGNPYYAPGGHHEMPQGVFRKWNLPPETRKVFDDATTGSLPRDTVRTSPDGVPIGHLWDGPSGAHGQYNEAIGELANDFLRRNSISPDRMTPSQAADLLAEIRESQDPTIRDYNRAMRMLRRVFRFRYGRSE